MSSITIIRVILAIIFSIPSVIAFRVIIWRVKNIREGEEQDEGMIKVAEGLADEEMHEQARLAVKLASEMPEAEENMSIQSIEIASAIIGIDMLIVSIILFI